MAKKTNINLRNQTIYQVFVRQHSKTSNFKGLINDLDRIKKMGVDIIYLLPFHKIGIKDRKGAIGSPYAIYDYYSVDPMHGTLHDLRALRDAVHKRGMKLMMDIVFNHTSRDSVLTEQHPDWFYRKKDGSLANRIGDWSDIADLDFAKRDVWIYLFDVLAYWAEYVDGFRCDVAPLLPIEFWHEARHLLEKKYPHLIWLTESVEYGFIKYLRDIGFDASSDSTMYDVFDIAYDYDIFSFMDGYLNGKNSLERWLYEIYRQEVVYPKNYVKLRSFENHDQDRIAQKANSRNQLIQLTALQFFLKGMPMIYAGQEHLVTKRPDLFELDLVPWDNSSSIENLIAQLATLKKNRLFSEGVLTFHETKTTAVLSYHLDHQMITGIFNLEDVNQVKVPLKDGLYKNALSKKTYEVKQGMIALGDEPIIIESTIEQS